MEGNYIANAGDFIITSLQNQIKEENRGRIPDADSLARRRREARRKRLRESTLFTSSNKNVAPWEKIT